MNSVRVNLDTCYGQDNYDDVWDTIYDIVNHSCVSEASGELLRPSRWMGATSFKNKANEAIYSESNFSVWR